MNSSYILVTGGAGYIGAHTCKELVKEGYTPVTFDNLSTGHKSAVQWGPFVEGDLRSLDALKSVFEIYNISGVIHFAAKAYVGESMKDPLKYFEGNIATTTNLLKVMMLHGNPPIVFSSSCATYGEPKKDLISEDSDQDPINPYGFTKLACEKLIKYQGQSSGLCFAILRYFNAAGADADCQIGESHFPETHVIPLLLQAARKNSIFKVYGNDYPTPDGTAVRDYIHVTDLATAHVLALQKLIGNKRSIVCNLGTGQGHSILDLISEVKQIYPSFKYEIENRRNGDPARLVADNTRSSVLLNWIPVRSDITNIINSTSQWQQKADV